LAIVIMIRDNLDTGGKKKY